MQTERLELVVEGVAAGDGALDVRALAPLLAALGTAFEAASRACNGPSVVASARVRGRRPRAFSVDLQLEQRPLERLPPLLAHLPAPGIPEVVARMGEAGAHALARQPALRQALRALAAEWEGLGLESLALLRQGRPLLRLRRPELEAYAAQDGAVLVEESVRRCELQPVAVAFRERYLWRFTEEDGPVFCARMQDAEFQRALEAGQVALSAGSRMRVELRTAVRRIRKEQVEHAVQRVLAVALPPRQALLFRAQAPLSALA
ncbi:MAG: hypothetical protein EYC70_06945 [Planctomycetota bacterium]|nr:MAG: hypothetical protein EYC70_06945 [Planctomycetota bacterium]